MSLNEVEKRKALRISIKEGAAANAMSGFGDQYVTPAILAVNGTASHIGILNAVTGILGPVAQIWGNKLEKRYSNKRIVMLSVTAQIILWLAAAAIPFFAVLLGSTISIYSLLLIYTGILIAGGILHPAFFSWMGNLVKKDERGRYFSKRGAIIGAVGLVSVLAAAFILDFFKSIQEVLLGFAILFVAAAFFRLVSLYYFRKQYEPKQKSSSIVELPWRKFMSFKDRMGRFTIGMAAFNFALMIASPFFSVYILQERGYSYLMYTIIIMGSAGWNLVFLPLVGKFSDKYGNASLLNLAGFLFTITPPMWIFLDNPVLIALIPQMLNGIANAAFNIGFANYIYANVPSETRGTAVAHINVLGGIGVVAGSLAGGFLLTQLRHIPNIFLILFLLATIIRGAVSMLFLSKLKDVRSSQSSRLQFDIIHPLKSIHHDTRMVRNLLEK